MIYVMGERRTGVVKIGRAINPVDRLKQVQAGYPMPLRLLVALPGDRAEEQWLHRRFAAIRMSEREWFNFGDQDAVTAVVTAVALYEADPDLDPHADPDAPAPPIENRRRRRAMTAEEASQRTDPSGPAAMDVYVTDEDGLPAARGRLVAWRRDPDGCWVGAVRTTSVTGAHTWEWVGDEALRPVE